MRKDWAVNGGRQSPICNSQSATCPLQSSPQIPKSPNPQIPSPFPRRRAFTLIELLVVIVVIGMLSAIALAALSKAREAARRDRTETTIAKINDVLMQQYESYRTRRLALNLSGLPPKTAALLRTCAIRDLMRMEMPEGYFDVSNPPVDLAQAVNNLGGSNLPAGTYQLPDPALHRIYAQKMTSQPVDHDSAKLLYLIVMTGNPDNRALFGQEEMADVDGDGLLSFVDGWGHPIAFLLWAPGFSANPAGQPIAPSLGCSDIQVQDAPPPAPQTHHDPFDSRGADPGAWQLFPLIYSGVISHDSNGDHYGVTQGLWSPTIDPYCRGQSVSSLPGAVTQGFPLTNQHMEQR
jgi:prepilin-type N-terminal cleavage/methylation domain-containing protein